MAHVARKALIDGVGARTSVDRAARLRSASSSLTVAIICLATLTLIQPFTQRALPTFPEPLPFTTSAAWLLFLAGLSLWLRNARPVFHWRAAGAICAAGVVGIALIESRTHIDALYVRATVATGSLNAGLHISPQATVAFLLIGVSLLLLDRETRGGVRPAQHLALAAAVIALATLLGYLYNTPLLHAVRSYPPSPIHESIVLFLLAVAVLGARPDRGLVRIVTSDTAGGLLARGVTAAVIGVTMGVGWVTLKGHRLGWFDVATGIWGFVFVSVAFFAVLTFRVARALDRTDLNRTRAEEQLRLRARQQAAVAELGQRALLGSDLPTLTTDGVRLIVDHLAAEWGELLELQSDGSTLVATVGIGREADHAARASDPATPARRVFASGKPAVVDDLPRDPRFQDARLEARGVVSAALVPIRSGTQTHGVLSVYSTQPRAFTDDDVHLLQTVASILAAAHERKQGEQALRLSEEKFSGLFRSSPDAIAVIRLADERLLEVNDGFLQLTGFARGDVLGQSIACLNLRFDPPEAIPIQARGSIRNLEVQFRTKSDQARVGLCSTEPVMLAGEPCVLTVIRDISELKRVQAGVQDANDRLARWVNELESRSREISLLNDMGDLLQTCLTPDEACNIAAKFARDLLPGSCGAICLFVEAAALLETVAVWGDLPMDETMFAPQECWGMRRGRLHAVQPPGATLVCGHVRQPLRTAYLCVPMVAHSEALGMLHMRHAEDSASQGASDRLTDSKQRLVVAIAEHVALALANLRLRERLRHQSIRDELTGLSNRRYMEEVLERELLRARRAARSVGLVLLDLDRFKTINDLHGHEAGDEFLKAIGRLFQSRLRAGDIVCRYGGEEFVFALPETTLQAAEERAEEIRSAVRTLAVGHRGRMLGPISVSAGVVAFPEHGGTLADLMQAADAAVYRAKGGGGDRVETGILDALSH